MYTFETKQNCTNHSDVLIMNNQTIRPHFFDFFHYFDLYGIFSDLAYLNQRVIFVHRFFSFVSVSVYVLSQSHFYPPPPAVESSV